MLLLVIQ